MPTDTDTATFNEIKPFIMRRMMRGESFESALSKAADDAAALLNERRAEILESTWTKLREGK
jgi:hypothetical protein